MVRSLRYARQQYNKKSLLLICFFARPAHPCSGVPIKSQNLFWHIQYFIKLLLIVQKSLRKISEHRHRPLKLYEVRIRLSLSLSRYLLKKLASGEYWHRYSSSSSSERRYLLNSQLFFFSLISPSIDHVKMKSLSSFSSSISLWFIVLALLWCSNGTKTSLLNSASRFCAVSFLLSAINWFVPK